MSVELISVLVAVLAIGVAQSGLILTSNHGLRQDMRQDMAQLERGYETTTSNWETAWDGWSIAKPSSEACWKDCERPSAGGRRAATVVVVLLS